MKDIQDDLRDILLALTSGEVCFLDTDAQRKLSAWIAMKTMVMEFDHPPPSAIPQSHRTYLKERRQPTLEWGIGISAFEGPPELSGAGVSRGLFSEKKTEQDSAPNVPKIKVRNTQTTLLLCGHFLAFAFSTTAPPGSLEFDFKSPIRRIWPVTDSLVMMPGPEHPMSLREAGKLISKLANLEGATYS